jgi:hypothetical protein
MADLYGYRLVKGGDDVGDWSLLFEHRSGPCAAPYHAEWANRHPPLGRRATQLDLLPGWSWPGGGCPPRTRCLRPLRGTTAPEIQVIWFAFNHAEDFGGTVRIGFCVRNGLRCSDRDHEARIYNAANVASTLAAIQAELDRLYGEHVVTPQLYWADAADGVRHFALVLVFEPGAAYSNVEAWLTIHNFDEENFDVCDGDDPNHVIPSAYQLRSGPWHVVNGGCEEDLEGGEAEWDQPSFLNTCSLSSSGPPSAFQQATFPRLPLEHPAWPTLALDPDDCTAAPAGPFCDVFPSYAFVHNDGTPGTTGDYDWCWDADLTDIDVAANGNSVQITAVVNLQISNATSSGFQEFTATYAGTVSMQQVQSGEAWNALTLTGLTATHQVTVAGNAVTLDSGAVIVAPPYIEINGRGFLDDANFPTLLIQPVTEKLQAGTGLHCDEFQIAAADDDPLTLTYESSESASIDPADSAATIDGKLEAVVAGGDVEVWKNLTGGLTVVPRERSGYELDPVTLDDVSLFIAQFTGGLEDTDVSELVPSTGDVTTIADGCTPEPLA